MTIKVRRVVTGHDGKGRAVVKIDAVSKNIVSNRPGASACVVWTTDTFPADNSGDSDPSTKKIGTTLPGGTVFRIIEFSAGLRGFRGTVHCWVNRGKVPCVMAFVLVDAKPAQAGGKTLNAFG